MFHAPFQKLKDLFWSQLKQGVSPEALALTVSLGVAIGHFPLIGTTTVICIVVAAVLKLNQALLQAVNYLLAGMQWIALPFFIYVGESLFGTPHVSINPIKVAQEFSAHPLEVFQQYGWALTQAVIAWALMAPVLVFVSYRVLLPVFRRLQRKSGSEAPAEKS